MAIVVTDLGHNQSSSAGSLAITTTAAVSAGDAIFLCTMTNGQTISSIVDTAANVYSLTQTRASGPTLRIYVSPNSGAISSSSAITTTFSGTARCAVTAFKATNLVTSSPWDVRSAPLTVNTGGASGTGPQTLNSFGLSTLNELVIFLGAWNGTAPGTITSPPSGFTLVGGNTATCFMNPYYKVVTDGAIQSPSITWTNSAINSFVLACYLGTMVNTATHANGMLTGVGA